MIDKYTAQAKTQEEAIEKGLKELGINRSEAEIEVNSPGKKGFLGFGAKDAVVTVKRKGGLKVDDLIDEAVQETKLAQKEEKAQAEAKEEPAEKEEAPVSEEKGDVEEDKTEEVAQTDSQDQAQPTPVPVDSKEDQDDSPAEDQDTENDDQEDDFDKNDPTENPKDQEAIEYVHEYLVDIIAHMGIDDASVTAYQDGRFIQYDIETEDAGLVIGRHGKVLNGLQTLAQIQLHQRADNKLNARIDAENYRSRRKDTVEHLAKKTAKQVMDTNQSVILEPMPAHERKQIHRYLSRYDEVQTHSEGKEPNRYLVVEPKDI